MGASPQPNERALVDLAGCAKPRSEEASRRRKDCRRKRTHLARSGLGFSARIELRRAPRVSAGCPAIAPSGGFYNVPGRTIEYSRATSRQQRGALYLPHSQRYYTEPLRRGFCRFHKRGLRSADCFLMTAALHREKLATGRTFPAGACTREVVRHSHNGPSTRSVPSSPRYDPKLGQQFQQEDVLTGLTAGIGIR